MQLCIIENLLFYLLYYYNVLNLNGMSAFIRSRCICLVLKVKKRGPIAQVTIEFTKVFTFKICYATCQMLEKLIFLKCLYQTLVTRVTPDHPFRHMFLAP